MNELSDYIYYIYNYYYSYNNITSENKNLINKYYNNSSDNSSTIEKDKQHIYTYIIKGSIVEFIDLYKIYFNKFANFIFSDDDYIRTYFNIESYLYFDNKYFNILKILKNIKIITLIRNKDNLYYLKVIYFYNKLILTIYICRYIYIITNNLYDANAKDKPDINDIYEQLLELIRNIIDYNIGIKDLILIFKTPAFNYKLYNSLKL